MLFEEEQKFRHPIFWVLLLAGPFFAAIAFSNLFTNNFQFTASWIIGFSAFILTAVGVIWLFYSLTLKTTIYDDRIEITYAPLINKPKVFPKSYISEIYIRQFKPLLEYGGWGIRYSMFDKGLCYNVAGSKIGIQIIFQDGQKLLISTRKAEEIEAFLQEYYTNQITK